MNRDEGDGGRDEQKINNLLLIMSNEKFNAMKSREISRATRKISTFLLLSKVVFHSKYTKHIFPLKAQSEMKNRKSINYKRNSRSPFSTFGVLFSLPLCLFRLP